MKLGAILRNGTAASLCCFLWGAHLCLASPLDGLHRPNTLVRREEDLQDSCQAHKKLLTDAGSDMRAIAEAGKEAVTWYVNHGHTDKPRADAIVKTFQVMFGKFPVDLPESPTPEEERQFKTEFMTRAKVVGSETPPALRRFTWTDEMAQRTCSESRNSTRSKQRCRCIAMRIFCRGWTIRARSRRLKVRALDRGLLARIA